MNRIIKIIANLTCIAFFCISTTQLQSQETTLSHTPLTNFEVAEELFSKQLYPAAQYEYENILNTQNNKYSATYSLQNKQAHARILQCKLRTEEPSLEKDIDQFILQFYPDVVTKDLLIDAGHWAYNRKQYADAIGYYKLMEDFALTQDQYSEVSFKRGYCHFVKQEFADAKYHLSLTKEINNQYYFPSNYYYGMCEYFDQNYDIAISSFKKVSNSQKYRSQVPYYIAQIYFAQNQFQELIEYGETKIKEDNLEKLTEIRKLLGQAYYQIHDYKNALVHLEYYEENTEKLTQKEFYQIAFTQYKLGQCDKAIDNFSELVNLKDKMGQVANYYLADCSLKKGELQSARTAFKKVSQMDYDKSMKDEASFNYGKLSAELNADREAINTLSNIDNDSPYYNKAQDIIGDVLLRTSDYSNAIKILNDIPNKNNKLKEIYQRVHVYRAIQLYNDQDYDTSISFLKESMTYPINRNLEVEAKYWIANAYQQKGNIEESIDHYEEYFVVANGAKDINEESAFYLAHYQQGYNYLKKNNYPSAEFQFKSAVTGIEINLENISNNIVKSRIYYDALARIGDCMFKYNRYDDALNFYTKASYTKNPVAPYAYFQKATLEGLKARPYDKILSLEEITKQYPNSEFADDAYYQLGRTYMELDKKDPAFRAFESIVNKYSGKSDLINESYLKMGLLSYNQGDAQKALVYYKKIFDNNPSSVETTQAMLAIEEIYISDMGKPAEYAQYLDSLPGYELSTFAQDSLTYQVAINRYENAEYADAVISFTSYLLQYNTGLYALDAHYYRGESNTLLKNYNIALQDYDYIIAQGFNQYYQTSLKKAAIISYNHSLDFNKAYRFYDLLAQSSTDVKIIHEASIGALSSAFRNHDDSGIFKYATKVRMDPLSSSDEISTASYYLGKTSMKQGNNEQAIAAFQDVISRSANNQSAESSYLISKIYFQDRKYDLAENQCNETNVKSGSYPIWVARSLLILSDIYVVKEDLFNARAALEAILENFNSNAEIVSETNNKLILVQEMENDKNRIKPESKNNLIELDTTTNGN